MDTEQREHLAALIQQERALQRDWNITIAKMLCLVLQVLDEPRHKDRAKLPGALREMIAILEK